MSPHRAIRWLAPALAFALLAGAAPAARADSRGDHPFQLQFDTGGLAVGYHLGRRLFIGFSGQPTWTTGHDVGRRYRDDAELYGQNGVDHVDIQYAMRNAFELRLSPFDFGLYFSLGTLHTGTDDQKITYDNRARVIGKGAYTTALKVRVHEEPQTTGAVGLGFMHVFRNGFSLTLGGLLGTQESQTPEVTVTDLSGTVSASDLSKFKKKIEDANRGPHGMLHLGIGWNF